MNAPASIDEYIAAYPTGIGSILQKIRNAIHTAAPEATETISYGIPTFQINGKNMVHFGAYADHIGFYATPDGHAAFETELNQYKRGKGSVQFPIVKPIPFVLIKRIAVFRAKQLTQTEEQG